MTPNFSRPRHWLTLATVVLVCSGCTSVRFNERETLARPDMQFDGTPLQAELENHIYSSREGASGTFSTGGGGGCGCY
ncbi:MULTISPECIES: DUF4266 domain-containing protein [Oceanospirillaceae]|jgi:hypothetical protein|uniref:DUF4266 domain-containing protein n=1 Tax=Oceanobacter antarcticus TaxID=3133425 RepID=A0ABW8ND14_9GAMM|tara:strand:- start:4528 stop:4761 length:234 start_codon:yes stop_codon:yes gene_type:complete